ANLVRQRRLRDVNFFRGDREVQLLGKRDEIPEVTQFHRGSGAARAGLALGPGWVRIAHPLQPRVETINRYHRLISSQKHHFHACSARRKLAPVPPTLRVQETSHIATQRPPKDLRIVKIGKETIPRSAISTSNAQTIIVRGHDLSNELIGK